MTEPVGSGRAAELLDAALTAFLEDGYAAIGVREITERAGVSHGTFYNYFDSKRQMLSVLVERHTSALVAQMRAALNRLESPVTVDLLESVVHEGSLAVLTEVAEHRETYRFLLLEVPGVDAESFAQYVTLFRAAAADIRAALDRARGVGLINERLDPVFVSEAWLSYVAGIVAGTINDVDVSTPEVSARVITDLLLYGAIG